MVYTAKPPFCECDCGLLEQTVVKCYLYANRVFLERYDPLICVYIQINATKHANSQIVAKERDLNVDVEPSFDSLRSKAMLSI